MYLFLFFHFIFLLGYFILLENSYFITDNKGLWVFYSFLFSINMFQTYFLNYKFFSVYSKFYYKCIIGTNILFFIINLLFEYIDTKNVLLFVFQIFINIFNISYVLSNRKNLYENIENRSLSSNKDYPEATYL